MLGVGFNSGGQRATPFTTRTHTFLRYLYFEVWLETAQYYKRVCLPTPHHQEAWISLRTCHTSTELFKKLMGWRVGNRLHS